MVGYVTANGVDFSLPAFATPLWPARPHPRFVSGEFQAPHRIKPHWDYRGIMGPVLECCAMAGDKMLKGLRAVLAPARPQDQVMRTGERVDAVDLDETQVVQNTVEVGPVAGTRPGAQQQVMGQKQATCALIVQDWSCHAALYRRHRADNSMSLEERDATE